MTRTGINSFSTTSAAVIRTESGGEDVPGSALTPVAKERRSGQANETMNFQSPLFRFRATMLLFITGLVISGVTAFPLLLEVRILSNLIGVGAASSPDGHGGLAFWILTVRHGLETTYARYPWIGYGTDWLAFGHLVIAGFFIGPMIHPASSRATLDTGIAACLAVIPLAMICGPIRGIPFYWRLIDCSFGLIGIVPLFYCLTLVKRIDTGAR